MLVPGVISSIYSVSDISTAILMERFYSNHVISGMDSPLALQEAQLWVRDLTSDKWRLYRKMLLFGRMERQEKGVHRIV
jgi:CHAT domain-containing protein